MGYIDNYNSGTVWRLTYCLKKPEASETVCGKSLSKINLIVFTVDSANDKRLNCKECKQIANGNNRRKS